MPTDSSRTGDTDAKKRWTRPHEDGNRQREESDTGGDGQKRSDSNRTARTAREEQPEEAAAAARQESIQIATRPDRGRAMERHGTDRQASDRDADQRLKTTTNG